MIPYRWKHFVSMATSSSCLNVELLTYKTFNSVQDQEKLWGVNLSVCCSVCILFAHMLHLIKCVICRRNFTDVLLSNLHTSRSENEAPSYSTWSLDERAGGSVTPTHVTSRGSRCKQTEAAAQQASVKLKGNESGGENVRGNKLNMGYLFFHNKNSLNSKMKDVNLFYKDPQIKIWTWKLA